MPSDSGILAEFGAFTWMFSKLSRLGPWLQLGTVTVVGPIVTVVIPYLPSWFKVPASTRFYLE